MLEEKLKEYLNRLIELEKKRNELAQENKILYGMEQELYEEMDDVGVDSIELDGIKFEKKEDLDFVLDDKFAGKKWDDIDEFFNWLREIGEADLIRVKKTVPWNTRKKFLKEYSEENKLPEFIQPKINFYIKYNKSEIKRRAAKK